ncbi:MAG: hypothetical protein LH473_02035 [Chitinophagales bacterium]|nr:hypothetical protein [Chitinophagales bacterium]
MKSLYFLDNNTGFISGHYSIYKTTNGGITWTIISTQTASYLDYFFVNPSVGIAATYDGASYKNIWRTIDGGVTWLNVDSEANYYINSVWFINENSGWAAGYYDQFGVSREPAIFHTTDGGITWQNIYLNHDVLARGEVLLDIRFKNELEGFAISDYTESIFTLDGGVTWTRTYDAESFGFPKLEGIYKTLSGDSELYLTGKNGYVVKWK